MTISILLPQLLLPQGSVKLGRFVTQVDQPHQNYHDPLSTQPRDLISVLDSYAGEHQTTGHSAFSTTLTSLVSTSFSKHTGTKVRLATDRVTTHALDNSDGWFDDVTVLSATRSWIERAIDRGDDIYLIVGFHTITNAKVIHESIVRNGISGEITAPVTLSLAAAGIILPTATALDPGGGAYQAAQNNAQWQFVAPGELVCALQYRKIRHRWLSTKKVDKARLSLVRQWPSMERMRDEEEGEDDVIEVDFAESDSLDGNWVQEKAGSEVIFVHSGKEL